MPQVRKTLEHYDPVDRGKSQDNHVDEVEDMPSGAVSPWLVAVGVGGLWLLILVLVIVSISVMTEDDE